MAYSYSETLKKAREEASQFDTYRNSIADSKAKYLSDSKYSKEYIRKISADLEKQMQTERQKALKQIAKLEKSAKIQLSERFSLFKSDRVPRDLREIFDTGFRLNEADFIELLSRYGDNPSATRLIRERAEDSGYVIYGITDRETEAQNVDNFFTGLRNFVTESDPLKRRFMDTADIKSTELQITKSFDIKRVEVCRKPRNLAEDMTQYYNYQQKIAQLEHDEKHPFETDIIASIFDRDEEKARKLAETERLYRMTEEQRKAELRGHLIESLTEDMRLDIDWMRTFRNRDKNEEISDSELAYVMSPDYQKLYRERAEANGKKDDYPDFISIIQASELMPETSAE